MSKIFDAMKLQAGETLDLTQQVRRMGTLELFRPPSRAQQGDFDRLANRILSLRQDNRGAVLGFASTASGEGASFVSYNAAVVLAQNYGQRVAWIDGNFQSPQKRLQEQVAMSFSIILQDPVLIGDLLPDTNPFVICAGAGLVTNKGLLAAPSFQEVRKRLVGLFDFVIIDMPPVLACPDTALMAAGCDGMLLVIEQKYLKREIIEHGIQVLKDKGVEVLGSVINHREFALPKVIYDRL